MPTMAWAMAGIYGFGYLFSFLLLDEKEPRIKADIIGPDAHSGRFPAMSARPTRPARPRFGVPTHGVHSIHFTS